jgi:hypothetical protein
VLRVSEEGGTGAGGCLCEEGVVFGCPFLPPEAWRFLTALFQRSEKSQRFG